MPSSPRDFVLNPAAYGLPTRDELVKLRIWDIHYHGFFKGGIPAHDEKTMMTPVPGCYLAGVMASGKDANRLFIENARGHGELIVKDVLRGR